MIVYLICNLLNHLFEDKNYLFYSRIIEELKESCNILHFKCDFTDRVQIEELFHKLREKFIYFGECCAVARGDTAELTQEKYIFSELNLCLLQTGKAILSQCDSNINQCKRDILNAELEIR